MRQLQLSFCIAAALTVCTIALGDAMHVPLHVNKHHADFSKFHARDAHGQDTNVVDFSALRLEMEKINRRYSREDSGAQSDAKEKRWINAQHLVHDKKLMDEDDGFADMLSKSVTQISQDISQVFHDGVVSGVQGDSSQGSGRLGQENTNTQDQSTQDHMGSESAQVPLSAKVSRGSEFEFVGNIRIGSPPQDFKINPDTGSSDLWVMNRNCTDSNCGSDSRNKYSAQKSTTAQMIRNKKFDLHYGIGDVSGTYERDSIQIGDLQAKLQTLGSANKVSADWKTDSASGVLGLGFRSITSAGQRTVLQNIASQNRLRSHVVSFAFGRSKQGTAGKSEMLIGDVNKNLFKGKMHYYKLAKVGYWQIRFKSFASRESEGISSQDAILDTGTSLIAASSQQAAAFWKGVKGARKSSEGFYTYPCDTKINARLTMPDGMSFPINEQDMNVGQVSQGSGQCVGTILEARTPGPVIMGLTMLKNVYLVYDFTDGNERVGLAQYSF